MTFITGGALYVEPAHFQGRSLKTNQPTYEERRPNFQIVPSYIFIIFTILIFNRIYYNMTKEQITFCFAIELELLFLVIIVICSDPEKLFEGPVELFVTQLSIIVSVR